MKNAFQHFPGVPAGLQERSRGSAERSPWVMFVLPRSALEGRQKGQVGSTRWVPPISGVPSGRGPSCGPGSGGCAPLTPGYVLTAPAGAFLVGDLNDFSQKVMRGRISTPASATHAGFLRSSDSGQECPEGRPRTLLTLTGKEFLLRHWLTDQRESARGNSDQDQVEAAHFF